MRKIIIAEEGTWAKKDTTAFSGTLEESRKTFLPPGLEMTAIAQRDAGSNHTVFTFNKVYGEQKFNTWTLYNGHFEYADKAVQIQETDFKQLASKYNLEEALVKTVLEIESRGEGFLEDGRPVILFEAHIFHRQTRGQFTRTHPDISSKRWNRSLYVGGKGEWNRLEKAASLDKEAAHKSASWGLGQVMGFNHRLCGYSNVMDFVGAMSTSEALQLDAMLAFIENTGLGSKLRSKDWHGFAKGYNGSGYRQNNYHIKLEKAYAKHSKNR